MKILKWVDQQIHKNDTLHKHFTHTPIARLWHQLVGRA